VHDQLFEWYKDGLAPCGLYADVVYTGTKWADKINVYAEGGHKDTVPCIRFKHMKGAVNWYLSRDGRIRIDAKPGVQAVVLQML
jgi:hypothetical protein